MAVCSMDAEHGLAHQAKSGHSLMCLQLVQLTVLALKGPGQFAVHSEPMLHIQSEQLHAYSKP